MFNNHFYYEGFKSKSNNSKSDTSTTDDTTTTDASSNINISISKDQLKQMIQKQISDASNNNTDTSTKGKSSEGFDILGLENNIKRGKQSNSIPVNQLSRNANDISPFEGSTFLGKFSLF
jgi:hypothetical protein